MPRVKGLAGLVVSLCDLCEAEGRLLEAGILRTVRRVGLLSLGLLFGAAALALILGALYALLTSLLPTPAALALLGGASAVIAAILLWSARGASPDAGVRKRTRGSGEAQALRTGSDRGASAHPAAEDHDIWADVPPYGHSAGAGTATGEGKAPSPKGSGA